MEASPGSQTVGCMSIAHLEHQVLSYVPYLLYLPLESFLCVKHYAEPVVYYFY